MANGIAEAISSPQPKRDYLGILHDIYNAIIRHRVSPVQNETASQKPLNLDDANVDGGYLESLAQELPFRDIDRRGPMDLSIDELTRIGPTIASRADDLIQKGMTDMALGHATWGGRLVFYQFRLSGDSYRLRITYISDPINNKTNTHPSS